MSGIDCRHTICDSCWSRLRPDRTPVRVIDPDLPEPELERCCYCGAETRSGIYVHDPAHDACILTGATRYGAVRFTRIMVLWIDHPPLRGKRREILCWRRRVTMSDGTIYEGNEVGAPLEDCLPHFTEAERAIVSALPRVTDRS
jgi:hypothetical protein